MTNRGIFAAFGLTASLLMLLVACAGPSTITLPDGAVAYRIDCSGSVGGMNYCFEKAGKSCGADGYTIVTTDGRTISSSKATTSEKVARVRENQTDRNSILVTCGT